jgi:hypothetical protein
MDKQTTVAQPGWAKWPAHPAEAAGSYRLHPVMAQALAPFAPAGSSVHADALEAERIAADLKRNAEKNSGALAQREIDRAHELEVKAGVVA